jgi:hypothetical protein
MIFLIPGLSQQHHFSPSYLFAYLQFVKQNPWSAQLIFSQSHGVGTLRIISRLLVKHLTFRVKNRKPSFMRCISDIIWLTKDIKAYTSTAVWLFVFFCVFSG